MTLEEILTAWDTDADIDPFQLGLESIKEAKLHAKYLRWLTVEKEKLRAYEIREAMVVKEKWELYTQGPTQEEWRNAPRRPWTGESFPAKGAVNRKEIDIYMNADEQVAAIRLKVADQKEKVLTLEVILKEIVNRRWIIGNYIANEKLKMGG